MKHLLFILCIALSVSVFAQNDTYSKNKDWDNGSFNKRVLKKYYSKSEADSLGKIINAHFDDFYCESSKCKYMHVNEDYFISINMNKGVLKIKYYFVDEDLLKIEELIEKIEVFKND